MCCLLQLPHHRSVYAADGRCLTAQVRLNRAQQEAVESIVAAVLEPPAMPKICLLQGPPGTGKSTTIKIIIQQLKQVLQS